MIPPAILLRQHYERRKSLRVFYKELKLEFEAQVRGLKSENEELIATCGEKFPDLNFQYFELASEHSTHFRIVGAIGIIVAVLSEAEGYIGMLVQLHRQAEVGDISTFLVIADDDNGESRIEMDGNERRTIGGVPEFVQSKLTELILPTITPARIRMTPEEKV
jgi:hypothetical protein